MARPRRRPRKPKTLKRTLLRLATGLVFFLLTWLYQGILKTPVPVRGEAAQLHHRNLRLQIKGALQRAQRSIDLSMYTLTDPGVLKILNSKAEEGLRVRIWYDHEASPEIGERLNQRVQLFPQRPQGLMHQKLLLVDEEEVWLGSANFTSPSLRSHENLMMQIACPEMAQWCLTNLLVPHLLQPPGTFASSDQSMRLYWLPQHRKVEQEVVRHLRDAQKTLRVAMFTFTRHDLAQEVIRAHKRGVDVQVVLDKESSRNTSQAIALKLKRAKVPVFVKSTSGLMHHKFAWIDGSTLIHGSANWTKAAYGRNAEDLCIMEPLTDSQNRDLQELWEGLIRACTAGPHPV